MEKIAEELFAALSENGFRVELDPVDRIGAVFERHVHPVFGMCDRA